jgi:hypothetical protein
MRQFQATVAALCATLIEEVCWPPADDADPRLEAVLRYVLDQQGRMPDYLRWPMRCLTLAFDWWGVFRGGGRFHRLSPAARRRQLAEWRAARLGFCRDFVRFYESLVVFSWFSCTHDGPSLRRPVAEPSGRPPG